MRRRRLYVPLAAALLIIIIAGATVLAKNKLPPTPELPDPSLKALAAQKGIQLGNFAIPKRIYEKPYSDILTTQFDFVLADNQPNWHFTDHDLRPSATEFDFKRVDEVFDYAEKHKMPVEFHHLVWGEQKWLPGWLLKGKYSKEQLHELLQNHIITVGQRYSGRVQQWSVVNEAFTRQQHLYDLRDFWADGTGDLSYIDKSFIWARQADPKGVLLLNDFNNESINDTSNAMYDYIKDAKRRGVPIDGIGMQMHIDGAHPPTKDEVISNMKRFGNLGIKVYVTEFDVNMSDVKADARDKDEIQANIYYEMMRACIESKVCPSFALLGITDKETWYNYIGIDDPRPLPFDGKYRPKPAFYGLRGALEQP